MTETEIKKRLEEIAQTSLQSLGDEAVLAILTERKDLLAKLAELEVEAKRQAEAAEKERVEQARLAEEAKAKEWEGKKQSLVARLAEVNKGITADQDDDILLSLIQERKILEAELKIFTGEEATPEEKIAEPVSIPELPAVEEMITPEVTTPESTTPEESVVEPVEEPAVEPVAEPESEKISINTKVSYTKTNYVTDGGKVSGIEDAEGRIVLDPTLQSGEYQGYLSELKSNLNSLGTFLQGLPVEVKRNRAFMLEVAKIDPAYAMHYADKDTLKKDEQFNVSIAGMNNQRNTGNPLSEMLPEMRTGAVLLAGVKNDFRNVRFVLPEMPEYETIVSLARKGALEAVKALKDAHDIQFLIPPVLQKDKAFMAEVNKLVTE